MAKRSRLARLFPVLLLVGVAVSACGVAPGEEALTDLSYLGNPDTRTCKEIQGDGRGNFSTFLSRATDSAVAYTGTGYLGVESAEGTFFALNGQSTAVVVSPRDGCPIPAMMNITILEDKGLELIITLRFDLALQGGTFSLADGGDAFAFINNQTTGEELAHSVSGTLEFNEIGGQDGNLVIGHLDASFDGYCSHDPETP